MDRREYIAALVGAAATGATAAAPRPNFVFLFSDDQRFDTVRALGNKAIHTPNLDRLVQRGTSFTHAYIMGGTMGAICSPSRAMVLTGQNLFHVRPITMPPDKAAPPRDFHFWPELLRKAGYTTWATGKWHNPPTLHARCFSSAGNVFLGGMGDQYKMPLRPFSPTGDYSKIPPTPSGRNTTEVFADSAIQFLQSRTGPEPFAMYVAFTSPHDPRTAPQKYHDMYPPESIELPASFMPEHPFDNGELKVRDEMLAGFPRTAAEIRKHIAAYYAMITHLDAQVGRILDALDASPHAKNTVVIYAGDNGLAVGRHGLMGKQNLYDHSVRVPLIVAGPGIPRGERRDQLCYLHDVCPTILQLASVPVPATVESQSLTPSLRDARAPGRESVFCAYRSFQRAVRTRDWKLIRYTVNGTVRTQLFKIADDPFELHDVFAVPQNRARVESLEALLRRWMEQTDDPLAAD